MGVSTILGFAIGTLENLPEILFYIQISSIIALAFIFGKISIKGYRNYIPRWVKLSLIMPLGIVSFLAASFLSAMFSVDDGFMANILKISQTEIFSIGVVCSVVLLTGLFLVSRNLQNINGIKKAIEKTNNRIEKAKRNGGFNPAMIAGFALIAGFFVFSFINFHGYPNLAAMLYNEMGTSPEEINTIIDSVQSLGSGFEGIPQDKIAILKTVNISLPVILPVVQILVHICLATLLFGWIINLGLVTRFSWFKRGIIRIGGGFLALFCAIAVSPYVVFSENHATQVFMQLFQFDVVVAGILSSVIIGVGVFLVSLNVYDIRGLKKERERMMKLLEKAREKKANQSGGVLKRPSMIAGVFIVILMVLLALMGIGSVPNMATAADDALNNMGMSRTEVLSQMKSVMSQARIFDEITNRSKEIPEGCPSLYELIMENADKISQGDINYNYDEDAKRHIEEASNSSAVLVFSVDYKGKGITLAVMSDNRICSATNDRFCECIEMPKDFK